jgi:hypothetical protein
LYTFSTISRNFEFVTLVADAIPSDVTIEAEDDQRISGWAQAVLNETAVRDAMKSSFGPFSVCSVRDPSADFFSRVFICQDLSTNEISEVTAPFWFKIIDVTFVFLLVFVVLVIINIVQIMFKHIENHGHTKNVSNSLRDPPYWQGIIPFISVETKANFRLWDSLSLSFIHILLYLAMFATALTPAYWPVDNNQKIVGLPFQNGSREVTFLFMAIPIIIVNAVCTLFKIIQKSYFDGNTILDQSKISGWARAIKFAFIILISATSSIFSIIFVLFIIPERMPNYKFVVYALGAFCFALGDIIYLSRSKVHIHHGVWYTIAERLANCFVTKYEKEKTEEQEELEQLNPQQPVVSKSVSPVQFCYMILSWIGNAIWIISLLLLAFNAGHVTIKVTWSTISNLIINSESLKTYSYFISIIGIFYKFTVDIEIPYKELRNEITSDRPTLSLTRMEINNNRLKDYDLETLKQDLMCSKDQAYYTPMPWTSFFKVAKMIKIQHITKKIIIQMGATIFLLCIFFMAAESFNTRFFSSGNENVLFGLIVSTIMPLIPRIMEYFIQHQSFESPISKVRLHHALEKLEMREMKKRWNDTEHYNWNFTPYYAPMKYCILNVIKDHDDPQHHHDGHHHSEQEQEQQKHPHDYIQ